MHVLVNNCMRNLQKYFAVLCLLPVSLLAQSNSGELRLRVTDPTGQGVKATIQISSEANQYRSDLTTNDQGLLNIQRLPYGIYQLDLEHPGFAAISESIEIRSSIPAMHPVQFRLPAVNESVTVKTTNTLIDPDQAGAVNQIGSDVIQSRLGSIPGRSLQDLVNSQPGWLYEGNAVLHPRGSEYQTQFVVDGIPLTDNRSPSFGPAIDADDVESMAIYTAGIPAEYGRKMGGVVEVNTLQDPKQGFHGQVELSGGSFDTGDASARGQFFDGKNTFGASVSGGMTDHYLNPVVLQNFSNTGTLGDFAMYYERELTSKDRLRVMLRHELSRYDIPNEIVQQTWCYPAGQTSGAPCQRQTAENLETMGSASYDHIFSPHAVVDFRAMYRDNADSFHSNEDSNPILVFQHNFFREGYFKGSSTIDHGRNEFKFGVESDNTFLNENLSYVIPNRFMDQFDPTTPPTFGFVGNRPDLEQSAFVQDLVRLGNWTVNAGLRWDHYQLLLNRQAVDPRVSISRNFPSADLLVHFSYDRVFQTPSSENILLSSSQAIESLAPSFLRYPVEPSEGNYYEAGLTKVFRRRVRLDTNIFRRLVSNYADDDQIDNTTISFPIAFQKAIIYGGEAKLEVPDWHRFSGFLSYSYTVGQAWFPVTGGLFLGDDADGVTQQNVHFPDSQDQRNTIRGHIRYQVTPRFWIAGGIQYDTGLPFEFDGDPVDALAQYGQQVLDRINFVRGRIYPAFQVNASAGAELYRSERMNTRFQIDGQNLNNVLNVIDFGGLFSGNAIGPPRSYSMRLTTNF
jgi:hypothetical protein